MPSESYPGKYFIRDMKAGQKIGGYVSELKSCSKLLQSYRLSGRTLLCLPSESYPGKFFMRDIKASSKVGGYVTSIEDCLELVQ
jgi:hypothetical protein